MRDHLLGTVAVLWHGTRELCIIEGSPLHFDAGGSGAVKGDF